MKTIQPILIYLTLTAFAFTTQAQDGTIYPLESPKEPNAIPLPKKTQKTYLKIQLGI
ncbi:hypothetical protein V7S76_11760 [Aquirufa sp. ROCK2-A2]